MFSIDEKGAWRKGRAPVYAKKQGIGYMDNDTSLKSRETIKLLNIYFRGIIFEPSLDSVDVQRNLSSFPNIAPYLKQREENQEPKLDVQEMAEAKEFRGLFPEEPAPVKQDWKYFYQWFPEAQKCKESGGVIKFFIKKDDLNFIKGFNRRAAGEQKIGKGKSIDLPEFFFSDIADYNCSTRYDPESESFIWNFERMLTSKPKSIYKAYQHYAHAKYSCRYIDPKLTQHETVKLTHQEYIKTLKAKRLNTSVSDSNIDYFCIRYSLELFQDSPYIPVSLKELIQVINREKIYFLSVMKQGKLSDPVKYPFNKTEMQNIKNYCGENPTYQGRTMPGVLSELKMEKEKEKFYAEIKKVKGNNKTFNKVNELYRLIDEFPSVRKCFPKKTIEIMVALYEKANKVSMNEKFGRNSEAPIERQDTIENDSLIEQGKAFILSETNEEIKKILKRKLYNEFKVLFDGEEAYIKYIERKPVLDLWEKLEPYAVTGEHNTNSKLFQDYCKITKKTDTNLLGKVHNRIFRPHIRKLLENIKVALQKEGLLDD